MNSLKTKNVKIVEKFVLFLCISLAVIAAGVVMMFVGGGMNLGVEFKGGSVSYTHLTLPTILRV